MTGTDRLYDVDTLQADVPQAIAEALSGRLVLFVEYSDNEGATTRRLVEPIEYVGRGPVGYLVAWCRLRNEVRAFRLDRITTVWATGATYEPPDASPDSLKR